MSSLLPVIGLILAVSSSPTAVVINEIAWMGTDVSYNDEWIELYNNSENPINLDDWQITTFDRTPTIVLTGAIPTKGFFLLERTNDDSVSNIPADLIYTGNLGNKGEYLKLLNSQGSVVDEVNCSDGWFSGDNETKQTMERIDASVSGNAPDNWQDSQNPLGTPKQQNYGHRMSVVYPQEIITPEITTTTTTATATTTEPVAKVYPQKIFINEILASPEGADAENEWIELYNDNDFEVDISAWQVRDTVGAVKTYTFPLGTKIIANGFFVLLRPESKITLQNSGDGLELLNPNKEIVFQINYNKAPQGQSYNRTADEWKWSATLTPEKTNIIPIVEQIYRYPISIDSPEGKGATDGDVMVADIGKNLPEQSNRFFTFLIAIIIAIASAVIVLIIKRKSIIIKSL